jgi:hypothetical protein
LRILDNEENGDREKRKEERDGWEHKKGVSGHLYFAVPNMDDRLGHIVASRDTTHQ